MLNAISGTKNFLKCIAFAFTIALLYHVMIYRKTKLPELLTSLQRAMGDREVCQCPGGISAPRAPTTFNKEGLCQTITTDRGTGQNVISYTLAGAIENSAAVIRYFIQLDRIAQQIAEIYPGWVMRIYHNYSSGDIAIDKYLCWTYCRYSHVDLCNVTDLEFNHSPNPVTSNVSRLYAPMWRFLPMADPTVSVFASRDIDSYVTKREAAAIEDWLTNTNTTLHILRDHRAHTRPILAGMWGARRDLNRSDELRTCFIAMKNDSFNSDNRYGLDENMLLKWLHPRIGVVDAARHESYRCTQFLNQSRPYPTQRDGYSFVGLPWNWGNVKIEKCPVECRPSEHQDWKYC